MPPLPEVPNVLRVDWQWSDAADNNVSTREFYRYSGGPPTSTDCVALAADIYSFQAANLAFWGEDTQLIGTKVTDLSSSSGGVGEHAQVTAGAGTGPPLSAGTAVLVNYVLSRRYRGGKPRAYFPIFGAGDLDTRQSWLGSVVSAFNSALATYFAGVIGSTAGSTTLTQHVNISYYDGFTVVTSPTTGRARNVPKPRTTPLVDNILSFATSTRPASQRRRNGR
jgi:hypothetical protein